MRIGLFIPCYVDAFFPEVGIATLELLERFSHNIGYPLDQTCCGQPMANSGFRAEAAGTAALFVRNFSGFDYVVAPSLRSSCAREFGRHRADRCESQRMSSTHEMQHPELLPALGDYRRCADSRRSGCALPIGAADPASRRQPRRLKPMELLEPQRSLAAASAVALR
jgi:L-lactate dehydrogenase complex protein LldE